MNPFPNSLVLQRILSAVGLGCTCGRCTMRWMPLYWVRWLLRKTSFYERQHERRMQAYVTDAGKRLADEIDKRIADKVMAEIGGKGGIRTHDPSRPRRVR